MDVNKSYSVNMTGVGPEMDQDRVRVFRSDIEYAFEKQGLQLQIGQFETNDVTSNEGEKPRDEPLIIPDDEAEVEVPFEQPVSEKDAEPMEFVEVGIGVSKYTLGIPVNASNLKAHPELVEVVADAAAEIVRRILQKGNLDLDQASDYDQKFSEAISDVKMASEGKTINGSVVINSVEQNPLDFTQHVLPGFARENRARMYGGRDEDGI